MSDKKLLLKEIEKKTVTKHKASRVLRIIGDKKFWRGASENFSKTGRLFTLTGTRGESNQDGEISPSDGERRLVCKTVRYDVVFSVV